MSQFDNLFAQDEEDGFEFGKPGRRPDLPPPLKRIFDAPAPLPQAQVTPQDLPTQKSFSTLFATSETVSLPQEPNVNVQPELHPLERARRTLGFSQKDLAYKSGVSLQTIRRYELGKSNPKLSTLRKLASSLNKPIDVISLP